MAQRCTSHSSQSPADGLRLPCPAQTGSGGGRRLPRGNPSSHSTPGCRSQPKGAAQHGEMNSQPWAPALSRCCQRATKRGPDGGDGDAAGAIPRQPSASSGPNVERLRAMHLHVLPKTRCLPREELLLRHAHLQTRQQMRGSQEEHKSSRMQLIPACSTA